MRGVAGSAVGSRGGYVRRTAGGSAHNGQTAASTRAPAHNIMARKCCRSSYSSAPLQTLPEPLQPPEQGTSAEEVVPGTPEAAAAAKTARTIRDQVKTREKTVSITPLRHYAPTDAY